MTNSDINDKTNLPHRVSLGDVLGAIEMSPGEVSAFLSHFAGVFRDSAHANLSRNFADHAALVSDPRTYGWKAPEGGAPNEERPYEPPTPGNVGYSRAASSASPPPKPRDEDQPDDVMRRDDTPTDWNVKQSAPVAQGESTTPGTLATSTPTPSGAQHANQQAGNEPAVGPTPAVTPPPPGEPVAGV